MNNVILSGRVVFEPELKVSGDGKEFCPFTLAVDRPIKNKDSERNADFVDCVVFNKSAVFFQKWFHKGDGITVEGSLRSDNWTDNEGHKRKSLNVVVENCEFPPSRKTQDVRADESVAGSFQELPDDDDGELPF